MPSLTLAIPFFNQLNDVKGIMGQLKFVTSKDVEWLIIDNGSADPIESFFRDTLKPRRLQFIRNPDNLGMVKTYQQIFDNVTTDIVAILHNDVFIYENNWDHRVYRQFNNIDHLGSIGFFGAQGVGSIGERIQDTDFQGQMSGISNMLEASQHGIHMMDEYVPAAILDGFCMIFNMTMIKKAGGLDQRYHYHHLYDRDLPLTSLSLGYKNIVLNVPCHHVSGVTANRHEYQSWIDQKVGKDKSDSWTHQENSRLFAKKWSYALPLYVEPDFSFRAGRHRRWNFKGSAILTPPK